jgi:hypothetical protein
MKLAIMQPYLFPYIGYFQLISAVDRFVIYDDVNFIKQGWINRNKILINSKEYLFTVHLKHSSSFDTIKNTQIDDKSYFKWAEKFLKALAFNYKNAPYFKKIYTLVEEVFLSESKHISLLATNSLKAIANYLCIKSDFVDTSSVYQNSNLSGQERILDICKKEKATVYINLKGGIPLYLKHDFQKQNIKLCFIVSPYIEYKQFQNKFIPSLSIIDILMFNSRDQTRKLLENYQLL